MINTFVFLDLETTGLITRNCFPKITELSMIAISRENVVKKQNTIPRVLHKLTIPINPDTSIPKLVETMTYLSNNNLSFVKKFENRTVRLIEHFLHNLSCPVCLVAHNGNKFDFPIFCHEISSLKMEDPPSVFDMLTADSIEFFREYFKNCGSPTTSPTKHAISSGLSNDFQDLLNDGYDQLILDIPTEFPVTKINECNDRSKSRDSSSTNLEIETTPPKKIIKSKTKKIEKNSNDTVVDWTQKKPSGHSLTTLFKHMLDRHPKGSHTAEGDCITLFECVNQIGECFAQWADKNATPLRKFKES